MGVRWASCSKDRSMPSARPTSTSMASSCQVHPLRATATQAVTLQATSRVPIRRMPSRCWRSATSKTSSDSALSVVATICSTMGLHTTQVATQTQTLMTSSYSNDWSRRGRRRSSCSTLVCSLLAHKTALKTIIIWLVATQRCMANAKELWSANGKNSWATLSNSNSTDTKKQILRLTEL